MRFWGRVAASVASQHLIMLQTPFRFKHGTGLPPGMTDLFPVRGGTRVR